MRWARGALWLVVGAALSVVMGCTGGTGTGTSAALTVLAPPSLTDAVTGMAHAFTTTYPGVRIETVFEPDSRIPERAAQTPAPDLILAEDPATLTAAGVTTQPVHFASGQLVLAVPPGNPAAVLGLADLARPEVQVALCDPQEPCGEIAAEILAAAEVTLPDSALREPDVRSALRHVAEATADAALVYRSDAIAAGEAVMTIEVPQSSVALAQFVAVIPATAPNPSIAQTFLDYLASAPVRDVLVRDGFRPPE